MLKLNRTMLVCLCAAVVAGCGNAPPKDTLAEKLGDVMEEAPEPPALDIVAPEAVATLDRNQLMSVLLIELRPGEQIPEHDAGIRAVYALNDSSLLLNSDDAGDVETYSTGDVDVWSSGSYAIENTGNEAARVVVVNRTAAPLTPPVGDMAASEPMSQPEPPTVLHSDEDFEIDRIELAPGSSRSVRCDNPCSVFTLTPATLVVDEEGGERDVMDVFESRSVWFDGGSTWTVEAGENAVGLVVFKIKK